MSDAQNLKNLVAEHSKLNTELNERLTKAETDVRQARQEAKEQQNRQQ